MSEYLINVPPVTSSIVAPCPISFYPSVPHHHSTPPRLPHIHGCCHCLGWLQQHLPLVWSSDFPTKTSRKAVYWPRADTGKRREYGWAWSGRDREMLGVPSVVPKYSATLPHILFFSLLTPYTHSIWVHSLFSGGTGTVWGEPCIWVVPGRFPNQGRSDEGSKEPESAGGTRNKDCPSNQGGLVRHWGDKCGMPEWGGPRRVRRGFAVWCVHSKMSCMFIFVCTLLVGWGRLSGCHHTPSHCISTVSMSVSLHVSALSLQTELFILPSSPPFFLALRFSTTHEW